MASTVKLQCAYITLARVRTGHVACRPNKHQVQYHQHLTHQINNIATGQEQTVYLTLSNV